MKKQRTRYIALANIFGTLGYISALIQWSWAGLILIYPILITRPDFLFPKATSLPPETIEIEPAFTPIMLVIAAVVTVVILAITAITLVRLPKTIGKRGATLTQNAARSALPVITHHRKISKKERKQLSYRVILLLKVAIVTLPLIAIIFASSIDHITPTVIWSVMLFCTAWSLAYFVIQQVIAKLARVDTDMLW